MGAEGEASDASGRRPPAGVDAAGLARTAVALLYGAPGAGLGGLGRLRRAFEDAGLGAAFASWVGPGANRPLSAAELERALGAEAIAGLARAAGASPARVAAGLAELLPRVVDELTPAGELPGGEGGAPAAARTGPGRA
ncbi:MAG TPA: YidB family protein [Steroidobacteraceae bacterium]|nr:YidB family protein [Steroidobacteraceae bacterium]